MGLRSGREPACTLEFQLEMNLLDRRKCGAEHLRGRSVTTQSVRAILSGGLGVSPGQPHVVLPSVGSTGDWDSSGPLTWLVST
jgi:hypothetical protein